MQNFYTKKLSETRGMTVIELLVVVVVIGILLLITLPQFFKIRERQMVKNAVAEILSSLGKARSQTLSSLNSSEYGVRFESNQVIIFKGKTFSSGAPDNEVANITSPASITSVTLSGVSGGSGDMYFNRLSGVPSKTGTITISASSNSKIITISATGTVSSN